MGQSVGWGLQNTPTVSLHRGKTTPTSVTPDTKQSGGQALVMLEL